MDDLSLNDIAALDAAELDILLIEQALHLAHVGSIRVVVIDVSVSVFVDVVIFWVYRWNGMFCVSLGDMRRLYRAAPLASAMASVSASVALMALMSSMLVSSAIWSASSSP